LKFSSTPQAAWSMSFVTSVRSPEAFHIPHSTCCRAVS
jgi:hypothetical protein